jgi:hypothetical protein
MHARLGGQNFWCLKKEWVTRFDWSDWKGFSVVLSHFDIVVAQEARIYETVHLDDIVLLGERSRYNTLPKETFWEWSHWILDQPLCKRSAMERGGLTLRAGPRLKDKSSNFDVRITLLNQVVKEDKPTHHLGCLWLHM